MTTKGEDPYKIGTRCARNDSFALPVGLNDPHSMGGIYLLLMCSLANCSRTPSSRKIHHFRMSVHWCSDRCHAQPPALVGISSGSFHDKEGRKEQPIKSKAGVSLLIALLFVVCHPRAIIVAILLR